MVAWTGLARVQVRLQNVSKTAAELRGFARNSADVSRPSNLLRLRANLRIGVRRRPVSRFLLLYFESRTLFQCSSLTGGVDGRIASMKPTIARAGRIAVMRCTYC